MNPSHTTQIDSSPVIAPFRPRARLLQLIGDELIGSPRLAVFELVKNAYDADATEVLVRLALDDDPPAITVTDDGHGMSLDTIRNVWLVPGDDHRQRQRQELHRTPKHDRLPIGEKGLGRFAVHKLGSKITLVTRVAGANECVVEIDWDSLVGHRFLDEALVTIRTRAPYTFAGRATGTSITISGLRTMWKKGDIRHLARQLTSICSPFRKHTVSGFRADLEVPGHESTIADIPDVSTILDMAIWTFDFTFDNGDFEWIYEFRGVPGLRLAPRAKHSLDTPLKLLLPGKRGKVVADRTTGSGIGPVTGEFYVYDRDREVLRHLSHVQLLKTYLNENGGIRVYRDGIRVYNYGEHEDWLGLDLRRVNVPARRMSNNIILGAIHLSHRDSSDLVEKTNREGFVENEALARFRSIVLGALAALEPERQIDKNRIRRMTEKRNDLRTERVVRTIALLRDGLDKTAGIDVASRKSFGQQLTRVERGYEEMQDVLTKAGMSGLNLAMVFHEVERGVRGLHSQLVAGVKRSTLIRQALHLTKLLDGFSGLLRKSRRKNHSLRKVALTARQIHSLRLARHDVELRGPIVDTATAATDATGKCYFHLAVGALNNLIDNAVYWLKVRWPEDVPGNRKLYLDLLCDFDTGPTLVVADNGVGFRGDDPADLTRPFFSRRPTGMGLGLYYVEMAMELCGGKCVFPDREQVSVPEEYDGAVVALVFRGD